MVITYHFLAFPRIGHSVGSYLLRIPSGGWAGVDVFFALSGFLVGNILLTGRNRTNALKHFMLRRFVRIIPLYLIVLISFYVLRLAFSEHDWLFAGAAPWWSYLTLTQNIATPILGTGAYYLGPTWSLAVEAQIYITLGIILTTVPERFILRTMISGIILAEFCRIMFWICGNGIYGYFVLPARIDGACFGVIAAICVRSPNFLFYLRSRRIVIWIAILILFAVAEFFSIAGQGSGSLGAAIYTHLALAFASSTAIAALVADPDGVINAILRARPLVALGTISYGVYMFHHSSNQRNLCTFWSYQYQHNSWQTAAMSTAALLLAVCLSAASWRYFESPLIRYSHRVSKRP